MVTEGYGEVRSVIRESDVFSPYISVYLRTFQIKKRPPPGESQSHLHFSEIVEYFLYSNNERSTK